MYCLLVCKLLYLNYLPFQIIKIAFQLGGSTLDAMAQAVEGASVIIIGLSQAYKDSASCRTGQTYLNSAKN